MKNKKHFRGEAGLSLIEILIGLTLIGIFAAIVGTNVMKSFGEGKKMTTEIQIKQIETAMDDFKRRCGFYPTTEQGLDALVNKPTSGRECANWSSTLDKLPKDAWGNDFDYSYNGKIIIRSFAADAKEGGEGEDKDISNQEL